MKVILKRILLVMSVIMSYSTFALNTVYVYGPEKGATQEASSGMNQYVLQLGLYKNKVSAEKEMQRYAKLTGYQINEKMFMKNGEKFYRLFIGPLSKIRDVHELSRDIIHERRAMA